MAAGTFSQNILGGDILTRTSPCAQCSLHGSKGATSHLIPLAKDSPADCKGVDPHAMDILRRRDLYVQALEEIETNHLKRVNSCICSISTKFICAAHCFKEWFLPQVCLGFQIAPRTRESQSPRGVGLVDLPDELLLQIFMRLDQSTRWHITEVCRWWRKLGQEPAIWTRFDLFRERRYRSDDISPIDERRARILLSQPRLSALHTIDLSNASHSAYMLHHSSSAHIYIPPPSHTSPHPLPLRHAHPLPPSPHFFSHLILHIGPSLTEINLSACVLSFTPDELMCVARRAPNLASVNLNWCELLGTQHLVEFFAVQAGIDWRTAIKDNAEPQHDDPAASCGGSLRRVYLLSEWSEERRAGGAGRVAAVIARCHPHLETLHLTGCGRASGDLVLDNLSRRCPALTDLHLDCDIGPDALARLARTHGRTLTWLQLGSTAGTWLRDCVDRLLDLRALTTLSLGGGVPPDFFLHGPAFLPALRTLHLHSLTCPPWTAEWASALSALWDVEGMDEGPSSAPSGPTDTAAPAFPSPRTSCPDSASDRVSDSELARPPPSPSPPSSDSDVNGMEGRWPTAVAPFPSLEHLSVSCAYNPAPVLYPFLPPYAPYALLLSTAPHRSLSSLSLHLRPTALRTEHEFFDPSRPWPSCLPRDWSQGLSRAISAQSNLRSLSLRLPDPFISQPLLTATCTRLPLLSSLNLLHHPLPPLSEPQPSPPTLSLPLSSLASLLHLSISRGPQPAAGQPPDPPVPRFFIHALPPSLSSFSLSSDSVLASSLTAALLSSPHPSLLAVELTSSLSKHAPLSAQHPPHGSNNNAALPPPCTPCPFHHWSDDCLVALATMCRNLSHVRAEGCLVTNDSVAALAACCPHLRTAQFCGTAVSAAAVQALMRSCSSVQCAVTDAHYTNIQRHVIDDLWAPPRSFAA